jgi:hypothetical protein
MTKYLLTALAFVLIVAVIAGCAQADIAAARRNDSEARLNDSRADLVLARAEAYAVRKDADNDGSGIVYAIIAFAMLIVVAFACFIGWDILRNSSRSKEQQQQPVVNVFLLEGGTRREMWQRAERQYTGALTRLDRR